MPIYFVIPIGILLLHLKTSLLPSLGFYHTPDFLIILSVYIILSDYDGRRAIFHCWCLGLLQDLGSCEKFGIFSLIFASLSFLVIRFKEEIFFEHMSFAILVVLILSLQCNFIHACLILFFYGNEAFSNIMSTALYSALVTPVFTMFFRMFPTGEEQEKKVSFR